VSLPLDLSHILITCKILNSKIKIQGSSRIVVFILITTLLKLLMRIDVQIKTWINHHFNIKIKHSPQTRQLERISKNN